MVSLSKDGVVVVIVQDGLIEPGWRGWAKMVWMLLQGDRAQLGKTKYQ